MHFKWQLRGGSQRQVYFITQIEVFSTRVKNSAVLDQYGLVASMSRKGDCYVLEHPVTLTHFQEYFTTRDESKSTIFDYIQAFYNRTKLQSALGYKSPLDYELNNNYINN